MKKQPDNEGRGTNVRVFLIPETKEEAELTAEAMQNLPDDVKQEMLEMLIESNILGVLNQSGIMHLLKALSARNQ